MAKARLVSCGSILCVLCGGFRSESQWQWDLLMRGSLRRNASFLTVKVKSGECLCVGVYMCGCVCVDGMKLRCNSDKWRPVFRVTMAGLPLNNFFFFLKSNKSSTCLVAARTRVHFYLFYYTSIKQLRLSSHGQCQVTNDLVLTLHENLLVKAEILPSSEIISVNRKDFVCVSDPKLGKWEGRTITIGPMPALLIAH